jgi:hypothetical protein
MYLIKVESGRLYLNRPGSGDFLDVNRIVSMEKSVESLMREFISWIEESDLKVEKCEILSDQICIELGTPILRLKCTIHRTDKSYDSEVVLKYIQDNYEQFKI